MHGWLHLFWKKHILAFNLVLLCNRGELGKGWELAKLDKEKRVIAVLSFFLMNGCNIKTNGTEIY